MFPVIKQKTMLPELSFQIMFHRWSYLTLFIIDSTELINVESLGLCCTIYALTDYMVEPEALLLSNVLRGAYIISFIIASEIACFSIYISSLPPLDSIVTDYVLLLLLFDYPLFCLHFFSIWSIIKHLTALRSKLSHLFP